MATPGLVRYHIEPFWDSEYLDLEYINEQFNDPKQLAQWHAMGFTSRFTGDMCDMRNQQPSWNKQFLDLYTQRGWKDIGTSYYRMMPGTVLPVHQDLYKKYVELFELHDRVSNIRRAVIFLQDWYSGHYFEGAGEPVVGWRAGDVVEWQYDVEHLAANIGSVPRYTLQITGHV
jgi:hypothetical protein